jgi:hypothetical protein
MPKRRRGKITTPNSSSRKSPVVAKVIMGILLRKFIDSRNRGHFATPGTENSNTYGNHP